MAITPPTFIQEAESAWNANTTPKSSGAFNVKKEDLLVAYLVSEEAAGRTYGIEASGITWTAVQTVAVSAYTCVKVWTAPVPADKEMSASFSQLTGEPSLFGGNILTFRGAGGVGKSAKTNVSGAAPSLALTTEKEGSAIVVASGDWNAVDGEGAKREWRAGAGAFTEQTYFRDAAHYTVYGGFHANAGAAGAKTVGLVKPAAQKFSIAAVEILGLEKSSDVTISVPAAAAVALGTAPAPVVAIAAPVATAAAGSGTHTPLIVASSPAAVAIATTLPPVPEIRPISAAAGAVAAAPSPTPAIRPAPPAAAAIATGTPPVPEVRPQPPVGASIAAATAPTPAVRPVVPAAAALAVATAPMPEIRPMPPSGAAIAFSPSPVPEIRLMSAPAAAVAAAIAPIPEIRPLAAVAVAVADTVAPIIITGGLILSYWQARARFLLGAARGFFRSTGGMATIAPTPPAVASFATASPQAAFSNLGPRAKFTSPSPSATIDDRDPTATIVT